MCLQADSDFERYLKVAFAETDTAIFVSDPGGRCLCINPQACSLTGYSKHELIGQDFFDYFQADDPAPSLRRDGFQPGKAVAVQGCIRRRDGSLLAVELRILKLSDGNFLATVRDITAQKAATETLRKNEELFRIAFDKAPTGMSIIAPDGVTYLAVNPLLCEMFGYTREEFLGRTIHLVTHPDDEELSNEWIRKKFNDEPCEPDLEKRYIHRDGHIIWGLVRAHWIKNDDGTHRMAIAHIQDITERKKAEEERKNLQIQLAVAMEMARLGYWEYDIENDTFTFNDNFYRIFRTTAERAGGYTMSSQEYASRFIHPDDRYVVEQEIRNSLLTQDPNFSRKFEHRILYDDGTSGHISVYYFIVKDDQGRTLKTCGINQDITDRKLAEAERRKLEDQVRQAQKMESIGLLAGGVAHDFNNLLTPILGYTDILSYGLEEEDDRLKKLVQIRMAALRAKEVAQQLLAFSREQLLELRTVCLGDIISKFENMLRRTIKENIEIDIKVASDLWPVKADPGQIEQVLLNLSINAQDAMPDGGHLAIEADNVEIDQAYDSRQRNMHPGLYVMISVTDTGIGMDEAVIKQIFEPFYTTKELGRGTGLGLSTSYGIIKQHGGFIRAISEKGSGSTFSVFLPKAAPKEEAKAVETLHLPDRIIRGIETVLVVEDNEMVRSLACDMLNDLGYKVIEAQDPECSIDLVKSHQGDIDLLLTDIIMPKMNGKELYQTLNHLHPNLKVIFMSGYSRNILGQEFIIDQGTHFIKKPFSLSELSAAVRRALDHE